MVLPIFQVMAFSKGVRGQCQLCRKAYADSYSGFLCQPVSNATTLVNLSIF